LGGGFRFDKESARAHLLRFSEDAFVERLRALVGALAGAGPGRIGAS